MGKKPTISGTKEWSKVSVNCVLGCPHRCRYCYARADAVRRKQIAKPEEWGTTYHRARLGEVVKRRRKIDGTVMFPTTHDITPRFLDECLKVLGNLLKAGNKVLIVSKPRDRCIREICKKFADYKSRVLFRFSIGATSNRILRYWEPGAPSFDERVDCLQHAHTEGFQTSVSCEPLLEADQAAPLFFTVAPFVTDSIWIGKVNHISSRVIPGTDPAEIARVEAGQTDEAVRKVYAALKDEPKVRWKESYKKVLGLELAEVAGLDQ
jgi:uncharacterized Fe-S cluster-containing radical SAM superfamily protein